MEIIIILFAIAVLVLLTFITYILLKIGIRNLPSLSDSFYKLKRKGWLFQLSLSLTALLLIPVMLELTPEPFKFIGFFVPASLVFTAFAPRFGKVWNNQKKIMLPENELERKVHQKSATFSAITSFVLVFLLSWYYNWLLLLTIPVSGILAYLCFRKWGQKIFFAEMACFGWQLSTIAILLFLFATQVITI